MLSDPALLYKAASGHFRAKPSGHLVCYDRRITPIIDAYLHYGWVKMGLQSGDFVASCRPSIMRRRPRRLNTTTQTTTSY